MPHDDTGRIDSDAAKLSKKPHRTDVASCHRIKFAMIGCNQFSANTVG
jgi:hypothetical protein